jgi:hypothetical protein
LFFVPFVNFFLGTLYQQNGSSKKKICFSNSQNCFVGIILIISDSHSFFLFYRESRSVMDNKEYSVLDRATTCQDWYHLWSSFGFSEHQWTSRASKVEEYTRVTVSIEYFQFYQVLIVETTP